MIDRLAQIPIVKQCELMGISHSSYYYKPIAESEENLRLMRLIDKQYMNTPFYGSRRMTRQLVIIGEEVNRKRIQRLMRLMCIEAMYAKPRTSNRERDDYKYPYLLGGKEVLRPNQVWGTDITFIPTQGGYFYLVAIIDLFSRYVLSWEMSNSMELGFCIGALKKALKGGYKPEIMNSDQGSQYTSKQWTKILKDNKISISMSGRGRCWDNIFVERLWRSLKQEEVYIKGYRNGEEAVEGIRSYFDFYNRERLHSNLNYKTPEIVYYGVN